MPKVKVYNLSDAKEVKEIELSPAIFDVPAKQDIIYQTVIAQKSNSRLNLAHTKDRSEVSGGGKKPWRQKGTGRARHGSTRSPIWVGGGVTFGPTKERNFSKQINKKTKRKALFMVLSQKVKDSDFLVVENLEIPEIKTKNIVEILKRFNIQAKKVLFITAKKSENIIKSTRNLKNIEVIKSDSLNTYDLLKYQIVFTDTEAVESIENIYKIN